jgi:hypothetical protein
MYALRISDQNPPSALATRLATLSRDYVPANAIDLLLAGKKIKPSGATGR